MDNKLIYKHSDYNKDKDHENHHLEAGQDVFKECLTEIMKNKHLTGSDILYFSSLLFKFLTVEWAGSNIFDVDVNGYENSDGPTKYRKHTDYGPRGSMRNIRVEDNILLFDADFITYEDSDSELTGTFGIYGCHNTFWYTEDETHELYYHEIPYHYIDKDDVYYQLRNLDERSTKIVWGVK